MQFLYQANKKLQALTSKPPRKQSQLTNSRNYIKGLAQYGFKNIKINKNYQPKSKNNTVNKQSPSKKSTINPNGYNFDVVDQKALAQLRNFHHEKLLEATYPKKDSLAQNSQTVKDNTITSNFNKILCQIKDELKIQLQKKIKKHNKQAQQSLDNKKSSITPQQKFEKYEQNTFKEKVFKNFQRGLNDTNKTIQLNKKIKVLDQWLENQGPTIELVNIDLEHLKTMQKTSQNLLISGPLNSKKNKTRYMQAFRRKNYYNNAVFHQQKKIQRMRMKTQENSNYKVVSDNQQIKKYESERANTEKEEQCIFPAKYFSKNQYKNIYSQDQFEMPKNKSLQMNQFTKRSRPNYISTSKRQKHQQNIRCEQNQSCFAFASYRRAPKQDLFSPFNMQMQQNLMNQRDQQDYLQYIKSKVKTQSKVSAQTNLEDTRKKLVQKNSIKTQLVVYPKNPKFQNHNMHQIVYQQRRSKQSPSKNSKLNNQSQVIQSKRCFKSTYQSYRPEKWDFHPW